MKRGKNNSIKRRKIKPTRHSVSGFLSYQQKPVPYESMLERNFVLYQIYQEQVVEIISQPITLPFKLEGRSYVYTPDYLVKYANKKPILVEVKPKIKWKKHWKEWKIKWKAAIKYCKQEGMTFHIWDESRILEEVICNITRFDSEIHAVVAKDALKGCYKYLAQHQPSTWGRLCDYLQKLGIGKEEADLTIKQGLANHYIKTDLREPLTDSTLLWKNNLGSLSIAQ